MTQPINEHKPQLSRAPTSASSSSLASSTRNASRSPTRSIDTMQNHGCWGYVYGAATFAKPRECMTPREQAFSTQVESNLRNVLLPRIIEDEGDALSPREKTIRAQVAQWRAEDEALALSREHKWDAQ